jgi:ubiquinone/menaquinone biosynthesis C-methylase UbiE
LEAGCGLGRFGIALAIRHKSVTLVDCSENSLIGAKRLKEIAERYFGSLDVRLLKGELEKLQFENEKFDVTLNEGVLEHWLDSRDRINIIKELARVTKKGGYVSVRVVNTNNFLYNFLYLAALKDTIPSYHRYSLKQLNAEMREAGLTVIHCDGEGINDPEDWVRNKWLVRLLMVASAVINNLPKPLRKVLCPSIFCIAKVKE